MSTSLYGMRAAKNLLAQTLAVFAALFGMVLFGDQIPAIGWAGMALIIASGIAATFLRSRALPTPPAEEH